MRGVSRIEEAWVRPFLPRLEIDSKQLGKLTVRKKGEEEAPAIVENLDVKAANAKERYLQRKRAATASS